MIKIFKLRVINLRKPKLIFRRIYFQKQPSNLIQIFKIGNNFIDRNLVFLLLYNSYLLLLYFLLWFLCVIKWFFNITFLIAFNFFFHVVIIRWILLNLILHLICYIISYFLYIFLHI